MCGYIKKTGDVDQQGYPHGIHEEQRLHFACGKSTASRSENDRLVVNGVFFPHLCEFTGRVLCKNHHWIFIYFDVHCQLDSLKFHHIPSLLLNQIPLPWLINSFLIFDERNPDIVLNHNMNQFILWAHTMSVFNMGRDQYMCQIFWVWLS